MKKSNHPLNDDELDDLQDILIERIAEDLDTTGTDEGICLLDELDGFFTALVSGPAALLPSVWLPALWGDYPPRWQSTDESDYAMNLLRRHQSEIAATLQQSPESFEPYYSHYEMDGREYEIVDDWCEGYLRGVRLLGDAWEAGHPDITKLLEPIRAFSEITDWQGHEVDGAAGEALRASIVRNVRGVYLYWLARRKQR
jgi:uncharacterized protein